MELLESCTRESLENLCRLCAKPDTQLKNLFNSPKLLKECTEILSIKVPEKDDGLPTSICDNCIQKLHDINAFKKFCKNNDTYFRELVQKLKELNKNEIFDEFVPVSPISSVDHHDNTNLDDSKVESTEIKANIKSKHQCTVCKKLFKKSFDLKVHTRIHTKEKPFSCNICFKPFSDRRCLNNHMKIHTDEKPFECDKCGKTYKYKCTLMTHLKTHAIEKPYACSECGKTFNYNHNLIIHKRQHTGERPYECYSCHKKFASRSTLQAHFLTHTNNKPRFICEICGKKCIRSGDLTVHMRCHNNIRPYSCTVCSKSFKMASHLKEHLSRHTREKYVCENCGKFYSSKKIFNKHVKEKYCK